MSKASNISSLSALRERREEIKTEKEAALQGLTSSLATAPQKARNYALEDLALPALGIGLAAYVAYRVLRSNNKPEVEEEWLQLDLNEQPQSHHTMKSTAAANSQVSFQPRPAKKQSFDFSRLISTGKLLIPAAQAIIGVIQEQKKSR